MKLLKRTLFCCLILILGSSSQLFAQQERERITNYDVVIQIEMDRSIMVTENISVYAAGSQIKRGITRSLPTSRNFQGKRKAMRYRIQEILRDGRKEAYHTKTEGGYKTLYIGEEDVYLSPGYYTYSITYKVPHQIALYENYDELYWNAIGTDVKFEVEKASCRVVLPEGIEMLQNACYTGSFGSSEAECTAKLLSEAEGILFEPLQSLRPYEGLTIGIGFEKGKMAAPSNIERFGVAGFLGLGLLGLLVYFFVTWSRYGVDPPRPTVFPVFESPGGRSPAALNYIWYERTNNKAVTASLLDLAIKGYIYIEETENRAIFSKTKIYKLRKLDKSRQGLHEEQASLLKKLFNGKDTITLDGKYNESFKKAAEAHASSIKRQLKKFVTAGYNRKFLTFPIIGSILIWLASWLVFRFVGGDIAANGVGSEIGPNTIAIFAFPIVMIISIIIYALLIKKPSPEKQSMKSAIEGMRTYLKMKEEERRKVNDPFENAPEHFEEMLPYAIALGVANEWSESFKKTLDKVSYEPRWSNNHHFYYHPAYYSSFSRSMQTASTPPSSSGGSGGGGFSGGGGGGGGVGGW